MRLQGPEQDTAKREAFESYSRGESAQAAKNSATCHAVRRFSNMEQRQKRELLVFLEDMGTVSFKKLSATPRTRMQTDNLLIHPYKSYYRGHMAQCVHMLFCAVLCYSPHVRSNKIC